MRKLGPVHFLSADGDVLFAHGHRRAQLGTGRIDAPGLWLWSCHCTDPDQPIQASGVSVAPRFQEMVLIASVPLTGDGSRPLNEGEVVVVSEGRRVDSIESGKSESPHHGA